MGREKRLDERRKGEKKGKRNRIPAFKELLLIGKDINTCNIYYQYMNFKDRT